MTTWRLKLSGKVAMMLRRRMVLPKTMNCRVLSCLAPAVFITKLSGEFRQCGASSHLYPFVMELIDRNGGGGPDFPFLPDLLAGNCPAYEPYGFAQWHQDGLPKTSKDLRVVSHRFQSVPPAPLSEGPRS